MALNIISIGVLWKVIYMYHRCNKHLYSGFRCFVSIYFPSHQFVRSESSWVCYCMRTIATEKRPLCVCFLYHVCGNALYHMNMTYPSVANFLSNHRFHEKLPRQFVLLDINLVGEFIVSGRFAVSWKLKLMNIVVHTYDEINN